MIHQLLEKLYQQQNLSQAECFEVFNQFFCGETDPALISAVLVALKIKGETAQEIAGAAQALAKNADFFDKPDYSTVDSCGTGGSGKHVINISTLVALLAASAGIKITKHGNRSVSSQCGSADVLEQLGVNINMDAGIARRCLDECGVTFLFAPNYHSGIRHVMPVRSALKTRTIFNRLGPLINPARPNIQLMGVYASEHCLAAAETLKLSGCQSAMVVHSCGCDEITLAGKTQVAELRNGNISEYELSPEDFGLGRYPLESLVGGNSETNAQHFIEVLQGKSTPAITETVAANAGALFYISGHSDSIKSGVKEALSIIQSGKAIETLQKLVAVSQMNVKQEMVL